ncbi:rhodanese-like domain-containing protein [Roseovarius sp. 2305UL8-3]|uniref:rhodanese-like domain-containing protein n=1 Tax=Roseovarius conchicola TaxID=3121636 RepID=UPI0035293BB7
MQRRQILIGLGAVTVAASAGYVALRPAEAEQQLTPPELLERVRAKEVILIDIRRPDEWAATGVAEGALPIDMRSKDFAARISAAMQAAPGRPVAVICARGVRSRRVTAWLEKNGLSSVIDVPEGMLGSSAGPGWVARGLPVTFDATKS